MKTRSHHRFFNLGSYMIRRAERHPGRTPSHTFWCRLAREMFLRGYDAQDADTPPDQPKWDMRACLTTPAIPQFPG